MTEYPDYGQSTGPLPLEGSAERVRLLESQVQILAQAVRALVEGLEGTPAREPDHTQAARGARLAHELLLSQGL